jgi:hypothetical protein
MLICGGSENIASDRDPPHLKQETIMRKSLIGGLAAFGLLASAQSFAVAVSTTFNITGASYANASNVSTSASPNEFSMTTSTTDYATNSTGAAGTIGALNSTDITGLNAAFSGVANNTIVYFSFSDSADLGYFGILIKNGSARSLSINVGPSASSGTKGVLTSADYADQLFPNDATGTYSAFQSFGAGNHYFIFGGLASGTSFTGAVTSNTAANKYGIQYMSWTGSSFTAVSTVGADMARSSSISVASYAVPAPAPVFLIGAALLAAGALRRQVVLA